MHDPAHLLPLVLCLIGCAGTPSAPPPLAPPGARELAALTIQPDRLGGVDAGTLRTRVAVSSFAYFRFIDAEFTTMVCSRLGAELDAEPFVNLHGDAHVEQYALASDGRGLADFDSATRGKPLMDWLRFTTSLWVATNNQGLGDATPAVDAFFAGYRDALANPAVDPPEPELGRVLRKTFVAPLTWVERVDGFMDASTSPADLHTLGTKAVASLAVEHPDVTHEFFRIKHVGGLKMGIGSARAAKFLVRVEGETLDPADDVIFEGKQVLPVPAADCRQRSVGPEDARHVIEGQRRLSRVPQPFLGSFEHDGSRFYVQAWRVNYVELSHTQIGTMKELSEIAFDVGVQLGRGHPLGLDGAPALRASLRALSLRVEPMVETESRAFAALVDRAWIDAVRGQGAAPASNPSVDATHPRGDAGGR